MLRPVAMVHLRVQVPSRDAPAATRAIAGEGLLHLIDLAHGKVPGMTPPAGSEELLAAFRDLARRVRQTAERLGCDLPEQNGRIGDAAATDWTAERDLVDERLRPVERAAEEAWRGKRDAADRAARARDLAARAASLRDAGIDPARLAKRELLELVLGIAGEADMERIAALTAPSPCAVIPLAREGEGWIFAAAVPASARDRLQAALRVAPCQRLALPATAGAWDAAAIDREVADAAAAVARYQAELDRLAAEARALLADLLPRVETGVLLLQAQTHFATAGRFTVMSGWVPAADADRLAALIVAATGGRAVVDVERPDEMSEVASGHLKVPILFRNPLLLRPFQSLLRVYGTPSYREVEPTAFFAASFLLMFGLMFGDVGHGAVLFSAGYLLFRHFPRFLDYGILLMEGAVASMIFGVAYGSVFGIEHLFPALWMRPLDDLMSFMTATAGLGVLLVSGGLILNAVNSWRAGERVGALTGTRGLLGAFIYWVVLALVARAALPVRWMVPAWLVIALAAAAALLIAARPILVRLLQPHARGHAEGEVHEGPLWLRALIGSVEVVDTLFSFFTNTLSFVRVAAFSAVHAGIMVALFALTDTLARMGRGGGVAAAVTMVLGNALIILLEGLTVSVQVLRLEYYEFFSKFFRGGGEAYRPLMLRPADDKGASHGPEPKGRPRPPRVADRRAAAARGDRLARAG
jgi:V/A-type H+-transporting ATPase subunit I